MLLLIKRGCILLNEKGEKVPGGGGFVGPAKNSSPEICQNSFREDIFAKSFLFEQLVEFDVKTSMGLAVVERDMILA